MDNIQLQVGVKLIIKNKQNEYLLLHRNLEKYPEMKGRPLWDIVGGRISPGISLNDNLKREIKEETGLELEGSFKLISAQDILRTDKHVVRLTYLYNSINELGDIRLSDEHDRFDWFTKEQLKDSPDVDYYLLQILDKI